MCKFPLTGCLQIICKNFFAKLVQSVSLCHRLSKKLKVIKIWQLKVKLKSSVLRVVFKWLFYWFSKQRTKLKTHVNKRLNRQFKFRTVVCEVSSCVSNPVARRNSIFPKKLNQCRNVQLWGILFNDWIPFWFYLILIDKRYKNCQIFKCSNYCI